jgi:membrane associated rhomboid family serine protease
MFLHAGWAHLAGNMVYLWIFGTNVEDYFRRRSFLLLYFTGGLVAALVHTVLYPTVCVPLIGASGAIAAVLGAYIILYPGTQVRVGVIFLRFFMLPVRMPALAVLGFWFVLQVFNGILTLGVDTLAGGGVAFFAHVGGFVFGMLFAFVYTMFRPAPKVDSLA